MSGEEPGYQETGLRGALKSPTALMIATDNAEGFKQGAKARKITATGEPMGTLLKTQLC